MNSWFDLKYAWRLLRKSWGYSLMCAAVVALSIGLAVWSFALTYSQMLKPLPFAGSERWYSVQTAIDNAAAPRPAVDAYTHQELLQQTRSAPSLGAFAQTVAILGEGQATTTLRAAVVTPRLFAKWGGAPQLGRVFDANDGQSGAAPVAILSFETWKNYFASDPAIIGKTARIDAAPVQIVGVMPKEFFALRDFELWMPLQMTNIARPGDSTLMLSPLIEVDDKRKLGAITSEMQAVVSRVNRDYPDLFKAERKVKLFPAARMYSHANKPIVTMISALAAAVLLLGCVNISMIFLARLLERSRELALRSALGASQARLLRQCLLETASIVVAGLVGGLAFAILGVRWAQSIGAVLNRVLASGTDRGNLAIRPIEFGVAITAAVVIWLLSTVIPALRVARRDAAIELAGSGKGTNVAGNSKSVAVLVALQVVVSCVVLVMCGSLVFAIREEVGKPSGITTERVILSTSPSAMDKRYADPSQRLRYWENLTAAIVKRVPAAEVAFMTASPTRPGRSAVRVESQEGAQKQGGLTMPITVVSNNYFDMLAIRLRSGRLFDSTDSNGSLNVAVVDEELAARYWPKENVIGKRVQLDPTTNGPWLTIVGVVSAVSGRPYRKEEIGVIYRPLRQAVPTQFQILVKMPNAAADNRQAVRAAAFEVDRDLPLVNLQTLDDYVKAVNLSFNSIVPVVIAIGFITALLAASGLFGLISRSVAQRTQEVGIRRALGGTAWRATSMFRRQAFFYLSVAVAGIAAGILVTSLMSKTFTNILDQVVPVTFGVIVLMSGVIFIASYLPTRRAVALEPGDALRYE